MYDLHECVGNINCLKVHMTHLFRTVVGTANVRMRYQINVRFYREVHHNQPLNPIFFQ